MVGAQRDTKRRFPKRTGILLPVSGSERAERKQKNKQNTTQQCLCPINVRNMLLMTVRTANGFQKLKQHMTNNNACRESRDYMYGCCGLMIASQKVSADDLKRTPEYHTQQ